MDGFLTDFVRDCIDIVGLVLAVIGAIPFIAQVRILTRARVHPDARTAPKEDLVLAMYRDLRHDSDFVMMLQYVAGIFTFSVAAGAAVYAFPVLRNWLLPFASVILIQYIGLGAALEEMSSWWTKHGTRGQAAAATSAMFGLVAVGWFVAVELLNVVSRAPRRWFTDVVVLQSFGYLLFSAFLVFGFSYNAWERWRANRAPEEPRQHGA